MENVQGRMIRMCGFLDDFQNIHLALFPHAIGTAATSLCHGRPEAHDHHDQQEIVVRTTDGLDQLGCVFSATIIQPNPVKII